MEPAAQNGPKEPRFTKVYDRGWDRLDELLNLKGSSITARLWVFLARHCGHDNALVCSVELLAEELACSTRTIMRATKTLEREGALVIAKIGTANAYILNDSEVWKTYEEHKRFCGFRARTLVSFAQNPGLKRRLTHVIGGQPELFVDDAAEQPAAELHDLEPAE